MSEVDYIIPIFAVLGAGFYMYYSMRKEVEELEEEVLVMEDEVLELEKKLQETHPVVETKEMEPQSVWDPPPLDRKKEGVLEKLERLELMKKDGEELSRSDVAFVERVKGYIRELSFHRHIASMSTVELDEYLTAKEEEYKGIPRIKPAHVEEYEVIPEKEDHIRPAHVEEYDGEDEVRREIEQLQREREERRRRAQEDKKGSTFEDELKKEIEQFKRDQEKRGHNL